ncbi:MAG: transporter [Anaerolineae bacterium]|nr:MAG: transporter [Anaerolineae bacterium]WKZ45655.1 MAG: queuosine precursor transporter [Anaerolineales bacterium]
MNSHKPYRFFDVIMAVFVTVLVVSNIASSAKIIDLNFNLFGVPLAFDAGTILFPISYIFGDILTEVYGYKRSRRVIWTGFFCLALASGAFWLVQTLPGEANWQTYAGDASYAAILGGMATGGIVFGSLSGYWVGEFANSFVLAKMKVMTNGRWLWLRTISSTLVGEFFDSTIFVLVATSLGVFPWELFTTLVVTNYLFKTAIEALMTPITYLITNRLKAVESEDYFDRDTNFNPFSA